MIQFRLQRYRDLLRGCLLPFELQIFLGELVFSSGLDNDHPLSSHLALHTLKQDPVFQDPNLKTTVRDFGCPRVDHTLLQN